MLRVRCSVSAGHQVLDQLELLRIERNRGRTGMGKKITNAGHTARYGRMMAAEKLADVLNKAADDAGGYSHLANKAAIKAMKIEGNATKKWESELPGRGR